MKRSEANERRLIIGRLRERQAEISDAIVDRLRALDASGRDKPLASNYHAATEPILEAGLRCLEYLSDDPAPPPAIALEQAQRAAWGSWTLKDIFDRYFACYSIFVSCLVTEIGPDIRPTTIHQLQAAGDAYFQQLIAEVGAAYSAEKERNRRSRDSVVFERISALLRGVAEIPPEASYSFGRFHVGLVGHGPDLPAMLRQLAKKCGTELLVTTPPSETWAWVSSPDRCRLRDFDLLLESELQAASALSVGEIGSDLEGWRRTHRQARLALSVPTQSPRILIRYSDVALLASALRDDLLICSLTKRIVDPIRRAEDGHGTLFSTLRAYLASGFTVSSAAAQLGVRRHTVTNRLRLIEGQLGQSLHKCSAELDLAMQLAVLDNGQ